MNQQEKIWFDKLHAEQENSAKEFMKPRHRGFWTSVIEKYSDPAHFIYELLQNADDANATTVHIRLEQDGLLFKHNGTTHFTISSYDTEEEDRKAKRLGHVNSITAVGFSTKDDRGKDNTIGKFGVGFKAVFQYTDTPEIYDDNICFRIVNYIVPEEIREDHPWRQPGETLFYLPFNKEKPSPAQSYNSIESRLRSLNSPILFLHNLKEIRWTSDGSGANGVYRKEEIESLKKRDIVCERFRVHNFQSDRPDDLWLFTRNVYLEGNSHPISVGFYIDDDKKVDTGRKPKIFCFFPTSETFGLCFVMHAPFALVDNRQLIKKDEDTNNEIFRQLARLAADALVCLCEIGQERNKFWVNENVFDIVPLEERDEDEDDSSYVWYNEFYSSFYDTLSERKVHLSMERRYVQAEKAVKLDYNLLRILTAGQYAQLTGEVGKAFVYTRLSTFRRELAAYISLVGITSFDIDDFGYNFSDGFIKKQDDKWILDFYRFLTSDEARKLIEHYQINRGTYSKALLLHKPFIRTDRKTFVAPFTSDNKPNVFIDDGTPKVSGLNYIDPFLYASEDTRNLVEKLKLGSPDKKNIIENSILQKYTYGSGSLSKEQVIKDFQYILEVYHNSTPNETSELLKMCSEKLKFRTLDGKMTLLKDTIYDYSYDVLNTIMNVPDVHILDKPFYLDGVGESRREKCEAFLSRFEFHKYLNVSEHYVAHWRDLLGREGLGQNEKYEIERSFLNDNPTVFYDYDIHTFTERCDNRKVTPEYSVFVWTSLLYHIRKHGNRIFGGRCEYFYHSSKKALFVSSLLISIRNNKWLYNKQGKLLKPQNICVEDLDERYEKSEELCKITGLRHSSQTNDNQLYKQFSESGQKTYEMGKMLEEEGITSKEEVEELIKIKRERERLHQTGLPETESQQMEDNPSRAAPGKPAESKELDERYASGKDEGEYEKPKVKVHKPRNMSAGLEDYIERQKQKMETEMEKENSRQRMDTLPIYTKDWFLCGLRYEYLNTEDTGKDNISRSVSLSFTKVMPEHSNVYRFCNASKPIPRWIEEIDGDIHVELHFRGGDEVTVNFAMACVQDFSLRLRAKGGDEKKLSDVNWGDLTTANLDINNPRGLVKNLYEAFLQLPFGGDYDFQKNLRQNVRFIFGPPGTGKTTYITRKLSELMRASRKCRVLVLAPTNQACDVITRQLMEQNPDSHINWLGRFVATNDEAIDQGAVVCGRESEIYKNDVCCVVSTIARLPYDFFENVNDGRKCLKDIKWDYVVCDEGSMISLPEIIYAIYKFSYDENATFVNTPIIIAGDPKQLQPIDGSNVWEKKSVYDVVGLDDFANPKTVPIQFSVTNLETQYRSVPAIGELFSRYSYGGKLKHGRKETDILDLNIDGLKLKPITYMPFPVDNYDDIYGAKRMAGSNVHIYSAIMTAEVCKYISKEYVRNNPTKVIKIGVICPYAAQVQLVEKLVNSAVEFQFSDKVEITAGTIHSFQGDECNIIFALFNPPNGMASSRQDSFTMLLNDDHLVNVAISRAKDYLCIMLPTHDSFGRKNLKDINRVADILLSDKFSRKKDTGQIDCEQMERLLFGRKGYLKSKSYITSHQMANVYTPTGYVYDIRVDESAIDIQVGGGQKQTAVPPVNRTETHSVETSRIDDVKTRFLPDAAETDPGEYEVRAKEMDDGKETGFEEEENNPVAEEIIPRNPDDFSSLILDAVVARDERRLLDTLDGCTGQQIPECRSVVENLVSTMLYGEDFWWLTKAVLRNTPKLYRKPIIDALEKTEDIKKYFVQDMPSLIMELTSLMFKDPEKISQDIDLLYHFRSFLGNGIPADIRKVCKYINQPETFHKIFKMFPALAGEEKVNFLLKTGSKASMYVLCQIFADKNYRTNLSQFDLNTIINVNYRRAVYDKLDKQNEIGKVVARLIRTTIQNVSPDEQSFVDGVFEKGYAAFEKLVSKEAQKNSVKTMDNSLGQQLNVTVGIDSVNHYMVHMPNGMTGLLPKKHCGGAHLENGTKLDVYVIGVHKAKKLYFVSPKKCTMQEFSEIPLANIGNKVVVEYYNEGRICNVNTGCLKCVNPIVLNQKKHFDYKAKYSCVIVGRNGFFDYEMKIVGGSEERKSKNVRLNKAAKEFNVGISTIVHFLRSKGHLIPSNPNARMTIEQYRLLEMAFGDR